MREKLKKLVQAAAGALRSRYELDTLGKVQGVGLPQHVKQFSASKPDRFACSLTNDLSLPPDSIQLLFAHIVAIVVCLFSLPR